MWIIHKMDNSLDNSLVVSKVQYLSQIRVWIKTQSRAGATVIFAAKRILTR